MFAFVTKTRISPERASEFVKTSFSSDVIANRTCIFMIAKNHWGEKTGNVSLFVEISAYNQKYSVFAGHTHYTRSSEWRWRRSESSFNLTILAESDYIEWRNTRIVCFNGWERTLTLRKNCETKFSQNITIDHLGQITIKIGDYFLLPDNFEKLFNDGDSELKSIFQISLTANPFHKLNHTIEMVSYTAAKFMGNEIGKKIGERSIKELVGLSF